VYFVQVRVFNGHTVTKVVGVFVRVLLRRFSRCIYDYAAV
jgi:hypothetical protein